MKDFFKKDQILYFPRAKYWSYPEHILSYPKYCYSKLRRKDYTLKLKSNSIMRLLVTLTWRKGDATLFEVIPWCYDTFPYFEVNDCVAALKFRKVNQCDSLIFRQDHWQEFHQLKRQISMCYSIQLSSLKDNVSIS